MEKKNVSRHFQEVHFPALTMVMTFTHKGTKSGLVLCQIHSSFITTSEPDMINRMLFTYKKCLLSISQRLALLCATVSVCLDWLLLVEVSAHTPLCRPLLLVHHKEKWRKHLDRERTEQSISAVITLKSSDISSCRALLEPRFVRSYPV